MATTGAAELNELPLPLEVLVQVDPKEANDLYERGVKGKVIAEGLITTEGTVREPVIIESSDPALEKVVIEAILKYRFKPPRTKAGKTAYTKYHQSFNFGRVETDERVSQYVLPKKTDHLPVEFQYDKPPVIKVVAPLVYPLNLLRDNIRGSAKVSVVVDPAGKVREVQILEATQPEFGFATRGMMQSWEFEPATKQGKRTWSIFTLEQKFDRYSRGSEVGSSARDILKKLKNHNSDIHTTPALDSLPVALYKPTPIYPAHLVKKGVGDQVVVEFFIDEEGAVQLPHIVEAKNDELAWIVLTAVSRWHFEPPLRQGRPVITRARLPMTFSPSK